MQQFLVVGPTPYQLYPNSFVCNRTKEHLFSSTVRHKHRVVGSRFSFSRNQDDIEQQRLQQSVSEFGDRWAKQQEDELALELTKVDQGHNQADDSCPSQQKEMSEKQIFQQINQTSFLQSNKQTKLKQVPQAQFAVQESQLVEGLDKNLRAEQFTIQKEERRKKLGAEIISIDKSYKPKVATWGVFARPENISKTFGGGRNIKPGQPYESEEEKRARSDRTLSALQKYRKSIGAVIDPEVERQAQQQFDKGMELFNLGKLSQSLDYFQQTVQLMSFGTPLGGQARLQYAICLDSLGRNDEAYPLYKRLAKHPSSFVAKKSKQLLFGFDAMENLKVYTMSYGIKKGAYEKYFLRFSGQWNNVYYSSVNEEDDNTLTTIFATVVMLVPFVLAVGLVLKMPAAGIVGQVQ
eukprot:TRINITY_DN3691_c0_g1_i1.p1 TRINITY_DN3691_c0_g1~~TRINITY_DN3691_c0_g1_i1.p1  ORF type:complete len:450 (-),score=35.71 TRINITY_DN3691_c0_g1_i1:266-1486(-)